MLLLKAGPDVPQDDACTPRQSYTSKLHKPQAPTAEPFQPAKGTPTMSQHRNQLQGLETTGSDHCLGKTTAF